MKILFFFTIIRIGPIETGKPNPKMKHLYDFLHFILFDVFFHSNYKKEKYIYNNHKKEVESKITEYKWQTITTLHKYLLTKK